jgi:hypothetical protein
MLIRYGIKPSRPYTADMAWYYYKDNHTKWDPPTGPFILDQLVKLILDGTIREDTFVIREDPQECHSADVFPEISERLPIDMDKLAETYLRYWIKGDWSALDQCHHRLGRSGDGESIKISRTLSSQ